MSASIPPPPLTECQVPAPPAHTTFDPTSTHLETRLHRASEILQDASLASILVALINEGYQTSTNFPDTHWDQNPTRFHAPDEIHDMLGADGLIVAVYSIPPGGSKESGEEEAIAAASVARWHGDMDGVGADEEEGWEIKAVTSKNKWGKMGLVGRCLESITQDLVKQEKEKGDRRNGKVKLWLHAVEEVNGEYWRKRGWKDVRNFQRPVGYWGSKFGFRLSVMLKEIDVL